MTEKHCTTEQEAHIDRIASAISATPPDKQSMLRAITEAIILGAQIGEQCAALAKKEAS